MDIEKICENIKMGVPVNMVEAIMAIEHQQRLAEERGRRQKERWWFRLWSWFKKDTKNNQEGKNGR